MAGYKGHRDRTARDPEYAERMAEYPPEFCDDVIAELAHFDVWGGGVRPGDKMRRPAAAPKGAPSYSSAKATIGTKGKDKDKGKGKGVKGKRKQ